MASVRHAALLHPLEWLQSGAIDLQAMGIALACCWTPPLKQMTRHKPPRFCCTSASLTLLAIATIGLQCHHIGHMVFLCTRPWFTNGTGNTHLVSFSCCCHALQCIFCKFRACCGVGICSRVMIVHHMCYVVHAYTKIIALIAHLLVLILPSLGTCRMDI